MKKVILGVAASALVLGAILFMNNNSDCCAKQEACCYEGSPCCEK